MRGHRLLVGSRSRRGVFCLPDRCNNNNINNTQPRQLDQARQVHDGVSPLGQIVTYPVLSIPRHTPPRPGLHPSTKNQDDEKWTPAPARLIKMMKSGPQHGFFIRRLLLFVGDPPPSHVYNSIMVSSGLLHCLSVGP